MNHPRLQGILSFGWVLITAGSMITLALKELEPPRLNVNGERWSESRRDSQPYLAHQIAERIELFFNVGNWIEDWQQFAFNGGQDCADKNQITSKIICFSKCWMWVLGLTYFFNYLHVISLPFSPVLCLLSSRCSSSASLEVLVWNDAFDISLMLPEVVAFEVWVHRQLKTLLLGGRFVSLVQRNPNFFRFARLVLMQLSASSMPLAIYKLRLSLCHPCLCSEMLSSALPWRVGILDLGALAAGFLKKP